MNELQMAALLIIEKTHYVIVFRNGLAYFGCYSILK